MFLVQNEEDQLLHKLVLRGIRVVQTLAFGVNFSHFENYLESFRCREIPHTYHIVFHSPHTLHFKVCGKCSFVVSRRRIIGNHQVLEVSEQHRQK